jgi:WD40 repeat protein
MVFLPKRALDYKYGREGLCGGGGRGGGGGGGGGGSGSGGGGEADLELCTLDTTQVFQGPQHKMLQDLILPLLQQGIIRFHRFHVDKTTKDMSKLGEPTEVKSQHEDWIHGVSFAPAGKMYVTVSGHVGQNLHVYNVNDNKLLKRLDTNHTGGKSSALSKPQSHNLLNFVKRELGVMDVTHSPCGGKLVTVSMDKYAHVFDVSDWNVDDVASKYASITAKRIICKIATGHTDTVSRPLTMADKRQVLIECSWQIYGVSFHPSGNFFGTVSADLTLKVGEFVPPVCICLSFNDLVVLKMWRFVENQHGYHGRADLISSFDTLHTGRIRGMAYSFGNCVTVSEDSCISVTMVEKTDLFRLVLHIKLHVQSVTSARHNTTQKP